MSAVFIAILFILQDAEMSLFRRRIAEDRDWQDPEIRAAR
jgi:hypothetical protein